MTEQVIGTEQAHTKLKQVTLLNQYNTPPAWSKLVSETVRNWQERMIEL